MNTPKGTRRVPGSIRHLAEITNNGTSKTMLWKAKQIRDLGRPEVTEAWCADQITANTAHLIATRFAHDDQLWLLQQGNKREISRTVRAVLDATRGDDDPSEPCPHCNGTGRL